jgi:HK97 family phage major capsid protein
MTSDVLHIARLLQPTAPSPDIQTATWKTENADIDETDLLLDRVTFTARTLPVLLKMSVELSEDSVNIDEIIERELSGQLALELDRAALLGSGTPPEPDGVRNQSGVNVEDVSGVTIDDYDFIIDAIGRVWAQNHEPTGRIYNSSLATAIAKFKSSADSQPLRVPDVVAAVPAFRTNQIPNDGGSPDSTTMFVADWSQLMIGLRSSFRLEVSRQAGTAFEKLQIWVRAYLRADVQLAHPEAFDVSINVGV